MIRAIHKVKKKKKKSHEWIKIALRRIQQNEKCHHQFFTWPKPTSVWKVEWFLSTFFYFQSQLTNIHRRLVSVGKNQKENDMNFLEVYLSESSWRLFKRSSWCQVSFYLFLTVLSDFFYFLPHIISIKAEQIFLIPLRQLHLLALFQVYNKI